MKKEKIIFYVVLFTKYFFLLRITPQLEIDRYLEFFSQCESLSTCLNPYENITSLSKSYLNFPYSTLMYLFLLPWFLIGSIIEISFINLSYLICEVLLIYTLKKFYNLNEINLTLIVLLNPVIIYSMGFLGQLDFIPLTFFTFSLLKLKESNKYYALVFLVIAASMKIIFIILVPFFLAYFTKKEKVITENFKIISFAFFGLATFNFQLFIDDSYRGAILYGLNQGFSIVETSQSLYFNGLFLIIFLSTITFFIYWRNLNRLDFYGLTLFSGYLTFPLFISNLSNIGWFLWSLPTIILLYISFDYRVKLLIYNFLILLVISDQDNNLLTEFSYFKLIASYVVYPLFFIILYYSIQALRQNNYFKIKSQPIIFAIAGDSATGKTTVSEVLRNFFGDNVVDTVELDSFHKFERNNPMWEKNTHLNPEMNNLSEFRRVMFNLINGKTEFVKKYNHLTGRFDDLDKKKIKDFLIVEGLHALHFQDLNKKYKLKIFLDISEDLKENLKISRDTKRKKDLKTIKKEINDRKSDFKEYIFPQIKSADLAIKTISSDENSTTFKLIFPEDLVYEFENLIKSFGEIITKEIKISNKIELVIRISKPNSSRIFMLLSEGVLNLKNTNFNKYLYDKNINPEVLVRSGFILYMLNKKIEINNV
jgi:uridine kinase